MRKLLLLGKSLFVSVPAVPAQSEIDTKRHCAKLTTDYKDGL